MTIVQRRAEELAATFMNVPDMRIERYATVVDGAVTIAVLDDDAVDLIANMIVVAYVTIVWSDRRQAYVATTTIKDVTGAYHHVRGDREEVWRYGGYDPIALVRHVAYDGWRI